MIFNERFAILRAGNVISAGVETLTRKVISRLEEHWNIKLTEENGGRMVTHLAMALMRIERGEKIEAPEKNVLDEFHSLEVFPLAQEIADDLIAWTPMDLPRAEKDYIIVNICLLLDN
ncbi:MAG: PRD domain-containing protein [Treponema sp.]|nr:PRD domain-containing protein [Treponema sp.]